MIGRTSRVSKFIYDKFLGYSVARYGGRKRNDFVVDALFYFEPVWRFEYRGDMFSFGGSSYSTGKGVLQ